LPVRNLKKLAYELWIVPQFLWLLVFHHLRDLRAGKAQTNAD